MFRVRSRTLLSILTMLVVAALGSGASPASIAIGQSADPGSEAEDALNGKLTFRRATPGTPAIQSEIWMMNGDGSHARRVTCNNRDDVVAAWSPDGQTIAFYSNERTPEVFRSRTSTSSTCRTAARRAPC